MDIIINKDEWGYFVHDRIMEVGKSLENPDSLSDEEIIANIVMAQLANFVINKVYSEYSHWVEDMDDAQCQWIESKKDLPDLSIEIGTKMLIAKGKDNEFIENATLITFENMKKNLRFE